MNSSAPGIESADAWDNLLCIRGTVYVRFTYIDMSIFNQPPQTRNSGDILRILHRTNRIARMASILCISYQYNLYYLNYYTAAGRRGMKSGHSCISRGYGAKKSPKGLLHPS